MSFGWLSLAVCVCWLSLFGNLYVSVGCLSLYVSIDYLSLVVYMCMLDVFVW